MRVPYTDLSTFMSLKVYQNKKLWTNLDFSFYLLSSSIVQMVLRKIMLDTLFWLICLISVCP